jgi:hypothetical protein
MLEALTRTKLWTNLQELKDLENRAVLREPYPRTIIDNDAMVGKNCSSWMEKIDGFTIRQKIYNKFVQVGM